MRNIEHRTGRLKGKASNRDKLHFFVRFTEQIEFIESAVRSLEEDGNPNTVASK